MTRGVQRALAAVLDLGGEIVVAVGIRTMSTVIAGIGRYGPVLSGPDDEQEWPDRRDGPRAAEPRMSRHLEIVRHSGFVDHHPANDALRR